MIRSERDTRSVEEGGDTRHLARPRARAVLVLLSVALGSILVASAIVWAFSVWARQQERLGDWLESANDGGSASVVVSDASMAAVDDDTAGGAEALEREGDAPPEVPPGQTPEGVAIDGAPLYLKCWDELSEVHRGKACGRLKLLEKRFTTRLYVVDRCKRKIAGDRATGKLSLGIAVDFEEMSLGFWSGPSSDVTGAAQITSCLRDELAGLPLHGIEHDSIRYRLFQTVIFGVGGASGPVFSKKSKLRKVAVVMDRVRVREEPVDGRIIGRISSGSKVRLLERSKGWCRIVTPASRVGWMTCEALER